MKNFVDLRLVDPTVIIDIRYATKNNFTGQKLYRAVRPLLLKDAALALARVQARLRKNGLGLKIWDAYRPLYVQKKLWNILPDERCIAHPSKNSPHCRGIALDLTLVDSRGRELPMPTGYDAFTPRAYRSEFKKRPRDPRIKNAVLLEKAMKAEGFKGFKYEWWHYDYVKKVKRQSSNVKSADEM